MILAFPAKPQLLVCGGIPQLSEFPYAFNEVPKGCSALMIAAYNALAGTLYFMGDFEGALPYAIANWRSESVQSHLQEVGASAVSVLCYEAQAKWLGSPPPERPWQKRSR